MKDWLTKEISVPRWLVILAVTSIVLETINWILEGAKP